MSRFTGVLLVSDFDNTLVDTRRALAEGSCLPALSGEDRAALRYFLQEDGMFAVATDRSVAGYARLFNRVPSNMPVILYNGAAIYHYPTKRYTRCTYMGPDVREQVEKIARLYPQVGLEFYGEGTQYFVVHPNEYTQRQEQAIGVPGNILDTVDEAPGPFAKVLLHADHALLEEICPLIEGSFSVVFSDRNALEITDPRATKGEAVRYLVRRWGVKPGQLYCVGDAGSDISMLQAAYMGFCPENAEPEVKAVAAEVVPPCGEGCIAAVIERLKELYPETEEDDDLIE